MCPSVSACHHVSSIAHARFMQDMVGGGGCACALQLICAWQFFLWALTVSSTLQAGRVLWWQGLSTPSAP
jgi:hypothetical protein